MRKEKIEDQSGVTKEKYGYGRGRRKNKRKEKEEKKRKKKEKEKCSKTLESEFNKEEESSRRKL